MTWVKLSDNYFEETESLSDAAARTHTDGLCFAMQRETGGFITESNLRKLAGTRNPRRAVKELVDCGFWAVEKGGWQIIHHMEHQPSTDEIKAKRNQDALRQKNKRRRNLGLPPVDAEGNVADELHTESRRDSQAESQRESRTASGTGRAGPGDITPISRERGKEGAGV